MIYFIIMFLLVAFMVPFFIAFSTMKGEEPKKEKEIPYALQKKEKEIPYAPLVFDLEYQVGNISLGLVKTDEGVDFFHKTGFLTPVFYCTFTGADLKTALRSAIQESKLAI